MSVNFRITLFFLLSILFPGFLAAQSLSVPYLDSAWIKPYEPFRVAGNVYYVGTYDLASYLITTSEGHILINTGMAESAATIREGVERLGFKFSDIRILLTNQVHYDHVAAFAEIKKTTGAKMMVNEPDAQVLADGGKSDFIFGNQGATFAPVTVDRILHDRDTIQLGDTKLIMFSHPGHTKGSCSFLLETRDEKRTWKLLIANIPTVLSEARMTGMPGYPTIAKDFARTFESMKAITFDIWVAAHASQFDLHDKRKPGDPYNPAVFADHKTYLAFIATMQRTYNKRLKEKK